MLTCMTFREGLHHTLWPSHVFICLHAAQQYIKVLSRPLAQNKSDHHVWSAVYLDYPTAQSEITSSLLSYMSSHIDAAHEDEASFKVAWASVAHSFTCTGVPHPCFFFCFFFIIFFFACLVLFSNDVKTAGWLWQAIFVVVVLCVYLHTCLVKSVKIVWEKLTCYWRCSSCYPNLFDV